MPSDSDLMIRLCGNLPNFDCSIFFRSPPEPSESPHPKTTLWNIAPWSGTKNAALKIQAANSTVMLEARIVMMDNENHHLQKDIERYTLSFFHHFFPKYVSRVSRVWVLKGAFPWISIDFMNFRMHRSVGVVFLWVWYCTGCVPSTIFLVGSRWISATTQRSILEICVVVPSLSKIGVVNYEYFHNYISIWFYLSIYIYIYVQISNTLRSTMKFYGIYSMDRWLSEDDSFLFFLFQKRNVGEKMWNVDWSRQGFGQPLPAPLLGSLATFPLWSQSIM